MLEKEVKQYKRGNSFTYRIDLSKKDEFEGGEKIMILRLSEYESFLNEIEDLKLQIEDKNNKISNLKGSSSEADSRINEIMDEKNKAIAKKNQEIMDLIDENKESIQKCYDIIDEKDKLLKQANEEIRIEREKTDDAKDKAQDEIRKERIRNDDLITNKDEEIRLVNEKLIEIQKESMNKNNTLTAYRLLIERYKSMSFMDRLLNKQPEEKDLNQDTIKPTYVLETEDK